MGKVLGKPFRFVLFRRKMDAEKFQSKEGSNLDTQINGAEPLCRMESAGKVGMSLSSR